ncbi:MAG: NAD(P)-dependent oxidoreductase [Acidimicrobiales bacterium]
MNIGFIGLGSMGTRIVTLMLDAGHHVTLWARRPASLEPFAGRVDVVTSPVGVGAASELVGICVWDESGVDEVVLGESGVLAGMRPGGLVAIHSTISPAACRRLHAAAADRGVGLVDAAVSVGSRVPKLLVMVGGEPDVADRCREAFESFGDPVAHLGPVGSGQIAKLVNNTLLAATVGLAEDAIALGHDLGLDEAALAEALAVGSSGGTWSGLLARRGSATDALPGRTNEWASKDVGLTVKLAAEAEIAQTREVLRLAARGVDLLG